MAGRMRLVILLLACALPGRAGAGLEVVPTTVVGTEVVLDVEVRNAGDQPLTALRLHVVFQGRELHRDFSGALPPGARHRWIVTAPLPAEPGTVPAVIRVHYEDAGRRHAVPAVAEVSTPPGILPTSGVRATLGLSSVTRFARGTFVLESSLAVPVHGRMVAVLPAGLFTEPESQAVDLGAGERREVPLILQRRTAEPGDVLPVVAFFAYAVEGHRHLAVASASTTVQNGGGAAGPLAVGAAALLVAFAGLAVAWRRAARRQALDGSRREHSRP